MEHHTRTAEGFDEVGAVHLPGALGIEIASVADAAVHARMQLRQSHLTPHGYRPAASGRTLALFRGTRLLISR